MSDFSVFATANGTRTILSHSYEQHDTGVPQSVLRALSRLIIAQINGNNRRRHFFRMFAESSSLVAAFPVLYDEIVRYGEPCLTSPYLYLEHVIGASRRAEETMPRTPNFQ